MAIEDSNCCWHCEARLARDNAAGLCAACQAKMAGDPPTLPRAFWDDRDIRNALTDGHMGRVIRAYREHRFWREHRFHGGRSLPQPLVAGWLGITQSRLSEIERAGPIHDLYRLSHYARVLRIPSPCLWFVLLDDPRPEPTTSDGSAPSPKLASAAEVDRDLVPHWLELLGVLTKHDDMLGPRAVRRAVPHELGLIGRHRQAARGSLRRDLMRVESRWADFACWLSDDAGDRQAGDYWIDRAMILAQDAEDELMTSYVLVRQSERAAERADAARAISLAEAAQRGRRLSWPVHALSAVFEARAHALAGNVTACEQKLEESYELVQSDQSGTWIPRLDEIGCYFATEAYVLASEGRCWVWLGRPRGAIGVYRRVLASWPSTKVRDRGVIHATLALARAAAGEPDRAAMEAMLALQIAVDTGSEHTMHRLRQVDQYLTASSPAIAISRFHDAFLAATSDATTA